MPESNAMIMVRSSTGQPPRTDLKTARADVPGSLFTIMKAIPGELTMDRNLKEFWYSVSSFFPGIGNDIVFSAAKLSLTATNDDFIALWPVKSMELRP